MLHTMGTFLDFGTLPVLWLYVRLSSTCSLEKACLPSKHPFDVLKRRFSSKPRCRRRREDAFALTQRWRHRRQVLSRSDGPYPHLAPTRSEPQTAPSGDNVQVPITRRAASVSCFSSLLRRLLLLRLLRLLLLLLRC